MLSLLLLMREVYGVCLTIGQQALNEFADLIDVEAIASQTELLHLLGLLVFGGEGDLEAEAVGVAVAHH